MQYSRQNNSPKFTIPIYNELLTRNIKLSEYITQNSVLDLKKYVFIVDFFIIGFNRYCDQTYQ